MATPRSTPSMNVPATQNTAPVIRFRCLYTYDMRRKAKRWQDGFLRYHTFNKRVMVYDVAGNFVGDHHWRQDEGIQDGDELKLDNGALIEVCEPVEKTETDLSGLYSNKRKGQGSPSQRPGGTPTPTTVVYNSSTPARPSLPSQQKPTRSLNDLLGIKKTPTQRAGSPQTGTRQSYTTPVNGKENEQVDYPAKRKKTETASEVARRREPASIDLTGPEPAPGPEISKRRTETSFGVSSRTSDPKNHTTTSTVSHLKPTDRSNNKPQRKQTASNPPLPNPQEQPQDPIPEPVPEPESPKNNEPPANILRLPSKTKPSRKKLMYHTILAQQQQQQQQQQEEEKEPQQQPQPQPQPENDNYDPIVVSDDDDNPPPSPPPHQQHNTTAIPTTTTPRVAPPLKAGIERRTSLQKSHSDPTAFTRFNMNTTTTLNNNNDDDDDNCHLPPQQHHNHRRRASESGNSPLSRTDTADNANNHEDESETGGPWTWEAQYLFDYWPAGRAKPTKTC
ncbi:hypothetical protein CBS115989_10542 [Aspergillus niger]|nr:hypothetical protein CBS115989_10542 [Aspergillus niger]KAI2835262.1 hypothetical protein CBS11232_10556 [Aspergillus niger]KAI2868058.1 hypothetical protein CBS115988_10945 [Aspergillus niger]|eukprot:XP_001396813.2 hypothetical protein ANI_1_1320134 [Aspergillus niger CBS 513.88]